MSQRKGFNIYEVLVIVVVLGALVIAAVLVYGALNPSKKAIKPTLTLVGGNVCNEKTHSSFYPHLAGLTPNGQAQLHVTYPNGNPYPYIASNIQGGSAGLIQLDSHGSYTSSYRWECWFSSGPGTPPDPTGTYYIQATDNTTGLTTKKLSFRDVAPKG